jgi:hypothetical protein
MKGSLNIVLVTPTEGQRIFPDSPTGPWFVRRGEPWSGLFVTLSPSVQMVRLSPVKTGNQTPVTATFNSAGII